MNNIRDFREDFTYCKKKLGFWSFKDLIALIGLTFDYGDSSQAPISGNFSPLS
jgi:hypothetical protein